MTTSFTPPRSPVAVVTLGGPSLIVELGSVRLLVDPTFDDAGEYPIGARTLTKTTGSFLDPTEIGHIDAVLLSHDQHPDNLDRLGRKYVEDSASLTLTTSLAASRLSGRCRGLSVWEQIRVGDITVTAVPAQHGPDGTEHLTGPVIGFVLESVDGRTVYISGDNASLAAVEDVAVRFPVVDLAVLFAGAASTPLVNGYLTLTSQGAVDAALILNASKVLPIHTDGWAHFTEGAAVVRAAFEQAGFAHHLVAPAPGSRTVVL